MATRVRPILRVRTSWTIGGPVRKASMFPLANSFGKSPYGWWAQMSVSGFRPTWVEMIAATA